MCKECGRGFRHESTFTAHQRTHSGEKPYCAGSVSRALAIRQPSARIREYTLGQCSIFSVSVGKALG